MLTRMLHKAGLFVGDRLLGAVPSNPHGHYEDEEVLRFHDRVLEANGCNWMFNGDAGNLVMSEGAHRCNRSPPPSHPAMSFRAVAFAEAA
jgi:hypothetical protein